jgi:hypothetical protein
LLDETVAQLSELLSTLNEDSINKVPYEASWTAGQVIRHITKSTNGMAKAILAPSKPAERDPSENVHQLRKIFLDFLHKMNSPDFIIPEDQVYNVKDAVAELNESFATLKDSVEKADLNDMVEGLPFGPTTKLELLHFVLFHTERHLHQLRKICEAIK